MVLFSRAGQWGHVKIGTDLDLPYAYMEKLMDAAIEADEEDQHDADIDTAPGLLEWLVKFVFVEGGQPFPLDAVRNIIGVESVVVPATSHARERMLTSTTNRIRGYRHLYAYRMELERVPSDDSFVNARMSQVYTEKIELFETALNSDDSKQYAKLVAPRGGMIGGTSVTPYDRVRFDAAPVQQAYQPVAPPAAGPQRERMVDAPAAAPLDPAAQMVAALDTDPAVMAWADRVQPLAELSPKPPVWNSPKDGFNPLYAQPLLTPVEFGSPVARVDSQPLDLGSQNESMFDDIIFSPPAAPVAAAPPMHPVARAAAAAAAETDSQEETRVAAATEQARAAAAEAEIARLRAEAEERMRSVEAENARLRAEAETMRLARAREAEVAREAWLRPARPASAAIAPEEVRAVAEEYRLERNASNTPALLRAREEAEMERRAAEEAAAAEMLDEETNADVRAFLAEEEEDARLAAIAQVAEVAYIRRRRRQEAAERGTARWMEENNFQRAQRPPSSERYEGAILWEESREEREARLARKMRKARKARPPGLGDIYRQEWLMRKRAPVPIDNVPLPPRPVSFGPDEEDIPIGRLIPGPQAQPAKMKKKTKKKTKQEALIARHARLLRQGHTFKASPSPNYIDKVWTPMIVKKGHFVLFRDAMAKLAARAHPSSLHDGHGSDYYRGEVFKAAVKDMRPMWTRLVKLTKKIEEELAKTGTIGDNDATADEVSELESEEESGDDEFKRTAPGPARMPSLVDATDNAVFRSELYLRQANAQRQPAAAAGYSYGPGDERPWEGGIPIEAFQPPSDAESWDRRMREQEAQAARSLAASERRNARRREIAAATAAAAAAATPSIFGRADPAREEEQNAREAAFLANQERLRLAAARKEAARLRKNAAARQQRAANPLGSAVRPHTDALETTRELRPAEIMAAAAAAMYAPPGPVVKMEEEDAPPPPRRNVDFDFTNDDPPVKMEMGNRARMPGGGASAGMMCACLGCKNDNAMVLCPKCMDETSGTALYCSKACRMDDWERHKHACRQSPAYLQTVDDAEAAFERMRI